MSNDAPLPARRPAHQEVQFDGDTLIAVIIEGDGVATPVRTVCETLGLDLDVQSAQLRKHPVLSQGLRVVNVPVGGRVRSVMAIIHKWIPFWLATISPDQVNEGTRPKLIRYQIEVAYVLAALYGTELSPAPVGGDPASLEIQQQLQAALREARIVREAYLATQQQLQQLQTVQEATDTRLLAHETTTGERLQEHGDLIRDLTERVDQTLAISPAQQQVIKDAILRIAARYKRRHTTDIFARLFSSFCNDLNTPRYSALPVGKYDDALAWLRRKAAEYLPDDLDALPPLQELLL
ncbi:MAG: hypothetical protein HGB28_01465 [Oscillochloris sp.]|nr:hypothetical protein [Oscillochloris sp.]